MSDENKNIFIQNLAVLTNPENFQKYILGFKGGGQPRAVYDVIKDCTGIGKNKGKKKKKHNGSVPTNQISFYTSVKGGKKKKKKGKKGKKHWHIDG